MSSGLQSHRAPHCEPTQAQFSSFQVYMLVGAGAAAVPAAAAQGGRGEGPAPKKESILKIGMSQMQKKYYAALLQKVRPAAQVPARVVWDQGKVDKLS